MSTCALIKMLAHAQTEHVEYLVNRERGGKAWSTCYRYFILLLTRMGVIHATGICVLI